jgi:uroporphyrinogen-III synthase
VSGPPPAGPYDLAIFVSEHAVRIGLPRLELGAAQVFAVGERTAAALAAAGHDAVRPEQADSEGLLGLPVLADVAGTRVLLVCGEGGRALLAESLAGRGARVERFVCYRRRHLVALPAGSFAPSDIDVIVAGSSDGLTAVARIWFAAGGSADVPVLVPSDRARTVGVALGFRNVHDCRGADTEAVLRGLAEALGTGTA